MRLSGWGRFPVVEGRRIGVHDRPAALAAIACEGRLIARGAGLSYGDAALQPAATLDVTGLNRFLVFDRAEGILACEAGVRLAEVIDLVVPAGWFPPVTPGTRFVTLGGMAAADVHGKNHHREGSFARHVLDLELALADGRVVRCSRTENAALFEATLGGMGLTGVILSLRFRLIPVRTAFIAAATRRAGDLDALLAAFEEEATADYSVAWIDCLAGNRSRGRGLLFTGRHALPEELAPGFRADPLARRPGRRIPVPFEAPDRLLGRAAVRIFNEAIWRRPRAATTLVPLDRFFYPLDAVANWNRIYGPRGFLQFQCVLPAADGGAGIARCLDLVAAAGRGSFLAVLKRLGPGRGLLSFPMEGHTLALDIPAGEEGLALYRRLADTTAGHGGRIYLAKDAAAPADALRAGYPELAAFARIRAEAGADLSFSSLQSERLGL